MGLAPHHHLVRQHAATRCNERNIAVLLLERDGEAARLEQPENIGRGLVREPAFFRDEVVFGAITRGDVVLG